MQFLHGLKELPGRFMPIASAIAGPSPVTMVTQARSVNACPVSPSTALMPVVPKVYIKLAGFREDVGELSAYL